MGLDFILNGLESFLASGLEDRVRDFEYFVCRSELTNKTKDVSELEKEKLENEYKMREYDRITNENDKVVSLLKETEESLTNR